MEAAGLSPLLPAVRVTTGTTGWLEPVRGSTLAGWAPKSPSLDTDTVRLDFATVPDGAGFSWVAMGSAWTDLGRCGLSCTLCIDDASGAVRPVAAWGMTFSVGVALGTGIAATLSATEAGVVLIDVRGILAGFKTAAGVLGTIEAVAWAWVLLAAGTCTGWPKVEAVRTRRGVGLSVAPGCGLLCVTGGGFEELGSEIGAVQTAVTDGAKGGPATVAVPAVPAVVIVVAVAAAMAVAVEVAVVLVVAVGMAVVVAVVLVVSETRAGANAEPRAAGVGVEARAVIAVGAQIGVRLGAGGRAVFVIGADVGRAAANRVGADTGAGLETTTTTVVGAGAGAMTVACTGTSISIARDFMGTLLEEGGVSGCEPNVSAAAMAAALKTTGRLVGPSSSCDDGISWSMAALISCESVAGADCCMTSSWPALALPKSITSVFGCFSHEVLCRSLCRQSREQ